MRRFEALVLPHAESAYRLAKSLTRQTDAAEDVVHDAYVRALSGFSGFRGADARVWLLTIVRHRAYDWLNARSQRNHAPLRLAAADGDDEGDIADWADPDQETPEQALIRSGEAAALRAAIACLPPRLREVLVLREMEDMSYREIAEVTSAPVGSVMSRLARARERLAEVWLRRQTLEVSRP